MNALAFIGTIFLISKLTEHGQKEWKRYLVLEKLLWARDECDKNRKQLDFINKSTSKEHTSAMLM